MAPSGVGVRPHHELLQRQLQRIHESAAGVPVGLGPLLEMVDEAYRQAHVDREQFARSLETMSAELVERNNELRRQLDEQREIQRELAVSEARFQAFMNNIPMLAALKRPTGESVYANQRYETMFRAAVGSRIEDILPPTIAALMHTQDVEVLATGQTVGIEGTLQGEGDVPTAWLIYKFLVPGATPADLLIGIAALDITERRRAEEALVRSRALLAEAHEIAHLGSWEYDVLTETARWSAELFGIYGAAPSEEPLTWESVGVIVPAKDLAVLRGTFARAAATGEPFAFDHLFAVREGERRVVHLRGRAVVNESGTVIRLVGTAQDITERKQLEERVGQGQRLESVGQLAAGIAHEINTPVQYVRDNLRFVQDALANLLTVVDRVVAWRDSLDNQTTTPAAIGAEMTALLDGEDLVYCLEELPVSVEHALEGTTRIAEIVRALKAVAHPGSESRTTIDLNFVIDTAIAVSRSEWKDVAEVDADLDRALPPLVCVAGDMHHVFLNLLVNAAQAIAEAQEHDGGAARRTGQITVRTRRMENAIEVRVTDNGGGISESIRGRVFDAFFTTKPVGKGTGQGLTLAHRVITNHQGRITFDSDPLRGTTFTILLPLGDDDLTDY